MSEQAVQDDVSRLREWAIFEEKLATATEENFDFSILSGPCPSVRDGVDLLRRAADAMDERDQLRHALQILLDSESEREQDKWMRELPVTKDWVEKYALELSKSTDWILWMGANPYHEDWPVLKISAGANSVCVTFKNRGQFLDLISGLDILGELRKEKRVE